MSCMSHLKKEHDIFLGDALQMEGEKYKMRIYVRIAATQLKTSNEAA